MFYSWAAKMPYYTLYLLSKGMRNTKDCLYSMVCFEGYATE